MSPRRIVTGLSVLVVLVAVVVVLTRPDHAYTVRVELPDAAGLKPHSSVKVAGVPGGTVEKLEITPGDTAMVTLKLDDNTKPIGRGASVEIRPTDLLGERYVALNVGAQKRDALPSGTLIPRAKTALPVELDDVLNTFDGETRERIKILVNEFGVALGARGKDLAKVLDEMPPSLSDARQLVAEITSEDGALEGLLQKGDALTATVSPARDKLGDLVAQASTTLKALADRRDKLGRALDAAPAGLLALNRTLTQLRTTSAALRPVSVDVKNAAAPLKATLDAVPAFEGSARESLRAAKTAAPALTKLGRQATPPLRALTPTLAKVQDAAGLLAPTVQQLDDRGFRDIMWFFQNFSLGMKSKDAMGHMVGAQPTVNPETVRAAAAFLFNGGTPIGEDPDAGLRAKSKLSPKSTPTGTSGRTPTSPAEPAPSPASPAPATTTDSAPAAEKQPDRGLLGGLVDGVVGLLGGNRQPKAADKPGPAPKREGLPGLLDTLLAP